MSLNYHEISDACVDGIARYLMFGDPLGSFLEHVVHNDLMHAAAQADEVNGANLRVWAAVLLRMPMDSIGTKQKVESWRIRRGEKPMAPGYFWWPDSRWETIAQQAWDQRNKDKEASDGG